MLQPELVDTLLVSAPLTSSGGVVGGEIVTHAKVLQPDFQLLRGFTRFYGPQRVSNFLELSSIFFWS